MNGQAPLDAQIYGANKFYIIIIDKHFIRNMLTTNLSAISSQLSSLSQPVSRSFVCGSGLPLTCVSKQQ